MRFFVVCLVGGAFATSSPDRFRGSSTISPSSMASGSTATSTTAPGGLPLTVIPVSFSDNLAEGDGHGADGGAGGRHAAMMNPIPPTVIPVPYTGNFDLDAGIESGQSTVVIQQAVEIDEDVSDDDEGFDETSDSE